MNCDAVAKKELRQMQEERRWQDLGKIRKVSVIKEEAAYTTVFHLCE